MGFIWSIIIGIVAGYLAGKIMRSELFCYYGSARYSTNPKRFKKACSIIKSYITWQQDLTKL